ncbi:AlpA family phage regulatory protein [Acidithiobacillus caldus]|uniref:helix-turn-helix transcriptional regulator n=1 Tax=Acidithiobacillus caldus TaxID=33059 RepID=UPI001C07CFD1|nr:AlpA family phage regulatory protein [Acidithiobacillus caldus]
MDKVETQALRAKDAARFCGIGRSTFLRLVSEGRAPKPRKLSPGAVVWLRDELTDWLREAK